MPASQGESLFFSREMMGAGLSSPLSHQSVFVNKGNDPLRGGEERLTFLHRHCWVASHVFICPLILTVTLQNKQGCYFPFVNNEAETLRQCVLSKSRSSFGSSGLLTHVALQCLGHFHLSSLFSSGKEQVQTHRGRE